MLLYQPSANIRVEISDLLINLLPIPFKRASIKIFSRDRSARENFDRAFKKIDALRRIEIEPNLSISKSKSIPSQEIFSNRLKPSKQKMMKPVFYPGSVKDLVLVKLHQVIGECCCGPDRHLYKTFNLMKIPTNK